MIDELTNYNQTPDQINYYRTIGLLTIHSSLIHPKKFIEFSLKSNSVNSPVNLVIHTSILFSSFFINSFLFGEIYF